jgi:predicted ATPase
VSLLAVAGYRSLQQLVLPMGALTLITGANGAGKSNLYRALRLVVAAARGDLVRRLAAEGGLAAALWAGPETLAGAMRRGEVPVQGGPRSRPVRLKLGFAAHPFSYALSLGYPAQGESAFQLDPHIKDEWIWAGEAFHPRSLLVHRGGGEADADLPEGLLRPLQAAELSDGTLRYLLLATALFSPRLPPLLVLNEPESSLHPSLLEPLARLIAAASRRSQVWVIAHAPALVEALAAQPGCLHHRLEKELGATVLPGQTVLERARWRWPG